MMKANRLQAAGSLWIVGLFVVIIMAGCGIKQPAEPTRQAAVPPIPEATAAGLPGGEPSPTPVDLSDQLECPSMNCYKPILTDDVKRRCASDTSRNLADFSKLKITMTVTEMCAAVGQPDWETGSGLRIFVYDLPDGSRILAGFAGEDEMMYVQQLFPTGRSAWILMH